MLRTIFVFGILLFGIFASFFNRYAALLLYLWFALFRPQEFVWTSISDWRFSLIIGLLLVIPCIMTGVFPNLSRPLSIGSILFLVAALVAQVGALDPVTGWTWLDYMTRLILVSLLAVTLISDRRKYTLVFALVAGCIGFYSGKAGLAYLIGGGVRFDAGLAGSFVDNNGYALGMAMVYPLLYAAALNFRKDHKIECWVRWGFFLALIFSPLAIIGTFSRGGFLALGAGGLCLILLQRRRFTILIALAVVLAIAIPFIPFPKGYFDRIETIGTYQEVRDDSALGRLHFWKVAVNMALDHPLGIGLKGYEGAYDQYDFLKGQYGQKRAVHSSHLEVLATTGFIGALIWVYLFLYAIYAALRMRKRSKSSELTAEEQRFFFNCANGLLASIVSFLVGGAFVAIALNDVTWLTFSLITSLDILYEKVCAEKRAVATEKSSESLGINGQITEKAVGFAG
jgi:putative inorganic carbon (hco3(-)) transporter